MSPAVAEIQRAMGELLSAIWAVSPGAMVESSCHNITIREDRSGRWYAVTVEIVPEIKTAAQ